MTPYCRNAAALPALVPSRISGLAKNRLEFKVAVPRKLIVYEAVHQIHGWRDLRRLEADRRCYSASKDFAACPSAVFWIKQVVEDLTQRPPRIRSFAKLSPIPGFRKWLAAASNGLLSGKAGSANQTACARAVRPLENRGQEPLDRVARFYLGMKRGWTGSIGSPTPDQRHSAIREQQSAGLMANYVYDIVRLERNSELFTRSGEFVCSRRVRTMAKQAPHTDHRA